MLSKRRMKEVRFYAHRSARLLRILRMLHERGPMSLSELAGELDRSPRSIERDLAVLRSWPAVGDRLARQDRRPAGVWFSLDGQKVPV